VLSLANSWRSKVMTLATRFSVPGQSVQKEIA
jgi:hypothetical protein